MSHSAQQAVTEYITRQEEHHRHLDFAEEFQSLLCRHGVDYDDPFVLG